jgi:hypothetical protein
MSAISFESGIAGPSLRSGTSDFRLSREVCLLCLIAPSLAGISETGRVAKLEVDHAIEVHQARPGIRTHRSASEL